MKNRKIIPWILAFLAINGLIVFVFNNLLIPRAEKSAENSVRREIDEKAMPKRQAAVIIHPQGISKYTEITGQLIDERIKLVEIPEKYLVKGAVNDLNMLKGKITKEDLRPGEQIVADELSSDKKWYGDFERLKEYSVSSIVADEVKTGNIVDLIVNYGDGSYDIVSPKVKVIKLIKGSQDVTDSDEISQVKGKVRDEGLYTIIFAVDETQYKDLELASKIGKFETRLYLDENQPASAKTFNYSTAIKRYELLNSSKSGSPEDSKVIQPDKLSLAQPAGGKND